MSPSTCVRAAAVACTAAWVALLAGCTIQPDSRPRDIPVDDRIELPPAAPEAGASTGTSRIYLVGEADDDGDRTLLAVLRSVDPPTAANVLAELFRGPNAEELADGFSSALPVGLQVASARTIAGTLNVDVSAEILELPVPTLQLAVAEIVFTASDLDGVRDVRIRVDGELTAWPDGRGELQAEPLSVYDFPGFAASAQPAFPAIPSAAPPTTE